MPHILVCAMSGPKVTEIFLTTLPLPYVQYFHRRGRSLALGSPKQEPNCSPPQWGHDEVIRTSGCGTLEINMEDKHNTPHYWTHRGISLRSMSGGSREGAERGEYSAAPPTTNVPLYCKQYERKTSSCLRNIPDCCWLMLGWVELLMYDVLFWPTLKDKQVHTANESREGIKMRYVKVSRNKTQL